MQSGPGVSCRDSPRRLHHWLSLGRWWLVMHSNLVKELMSAATASHAAHGSERPTIMSEEY
jgi:hypothetical protein